MSNDSRRVSQLGVTTSLSTTDRLVVLTNPASSAQTQTITVNNFVSNFTVANTTSRGLVSLNGNTIGSNTTGGISVNVAATYAWTNTHTFSNTITFGNSSINSTINSTSISTNTLNLSEFTNSANGYTYLPNGFKLNWGWVSANSTNGNATFSSPYTTNVYSVTTTSNTAVATYQSAVVSQNNTVAVVRTGNATSTNVFWQAIGY